ncbi:M50 family metallopeptidase [Carboxylicivirga sp. N1Y90]|uniref:M50 family metallopeptidase n=1 Tax=Carboxylicivirga fragile TaxID=3417571 RepID=UPI003D351A05|nr:M50 family metallopeptidase [Marinilabiliaceae bacterium N1Y90]
MQKKLLILILTVILYWVLKNYIPYGNMVLYPLTLLVTFFHETGHAFFAVITGGSVHGIQINNDGSGYALIAGGISLLVIPGGYIGSALWGNLLLFVALHKDRYSKFVLYLITFVLIFSAIVWFSSIGTSLLLFAFAALCYWLSRLNANVQTNTLLVIGAISLVYILMDFNGGPSSDLNKFTQLIPIFPSFIWALIWLAIVAYITYLNLKIIWRKK